MSDSPELNPLSLSEILARDASTLSDEEIATLVLAYRAERQAMLEAEAKGSKKAKSILSAADKAAIGLKLTFEDLQL